MRRSGNGNDEEYKSYTEENGVESTKKKWEGMKNLRKSEPKVDNYDEDRNKLYTLVSGDIPWRPPQFRTQSTRQERENFGSGEFVTVTELTEIKMLKFVFIAFDDGDILFAPLFFFISHLTDYDYITKFFAGAVFPFHLQIIYFVVDSQQHYVVN